MKYLYPNSTKQGSIDIKDSAFYLSWKAMCIRLNPSTTLKVRFFFLHSGLVKSWQLWTWSDTLKVDEDGVKILPEKFGRDEGTPLKDSKMGAL